MNLTKTQSTIIHWTRFLCAQAVVLSHLFGFFKWESGFSKYMGCYGVLVFFILSGFLIASSIKHNIERNPQYGFSNYFADRFFRIYPPFIASLLLVFFIDIAQFEYLNREYSLKQYCINLLINSLQLQEFPLATYLNEHYMIEAFRFRVMGTNTPLWTISIEWWLYMFFGFLVFRIIRNDQARIVHWTILLFLAITPVYFMIIADRMDKGLSLIWFLGALGASTRFFTVNYLSRRTFLISLGLMIVGLFSFDYIGYNGAILSFFIGFYALMLHRNAHLIILERTFTVSKFCASYSFSLYLTHYSIIWFITAVIPMSFTNSELWSIFAFVNLIALGFAYLFEWPSERWKKQWEKYRINRNSAP